MLAIKNAGFPHRLSYNFEIPSVITTLDYDGINKFIHH